MTCITVSSGKVPKSKLAKEAESHRQCTIAGLKLSGLNTNMSTLQADTKFMIVTTRYLMFLKTAEPDCKGLHSTVKIRKNT